MTSRSWAKLRTKRWDIAVIAGFVVFAALVQLSSWRGLRPYVLLDGDTANIATFAAAWQQPERFVGDAVLGDRVAIQFYVTALIPLVQGLYPIVGDYGTAFNVLLGPHVFLYTLGWYLLGRHLLESRRWALCYALANCVTIQTMSSDYWGLCGDVMPRLSFQTLLPFLLLVMLRYAGRIRLWPAFMAASGALLYVHPVSAPSVAFANLLGLASCKAVAPSRRWVAFVASGATFLVIVLPFALIYGRHHSSGPVADYASTIAAMRRLQGDEFYDAGIALRHYLSHPFMTLVYAAGAAGLVSVAKWLPERRADARFFAFWLVGLLATTVGVTAVEQSVCARMHRLPFEIDLIRNLRYAVPVLILFAVAGVKLLAASVRTGASRIAVLGTACAVLLAWLGLYRARTIPLGDELRCLSRGHVICTPESAQRLEEALLYMKDRLPADSRILPSVGTDAAMAVRYVALQPVLYCDKDRNVITYGAADRLPAWTRVETAMDAAQSEPTLALRLAALGEVSRDLGADFLFVDADAPEDAVPSGLRVVHRNSAYSVLKVEQTPKTDS